jgi:endonuclease YncB( thermonuclease family)
MFPGRRRFLWLTSLIAAFFFANSSFAETLLGEVVGISDGDTLTVLDADRKTHKIRLAGIDSPESKQPYGQRAKESLSNLAYRQRAQIEWTKADRYGRIVGKVIVGGKDVCLEQIRQGMAWHYKKYQNEQPLEDRLAYAKAEREAREMRLGLWSEPGTIPPWDWRKANR